MEGDATTGIQRNIYVPRGTYTLMLTGAGDVTQGDLDITRGTVIVGTGAGESIIDAGNIPERLFDVTSTGILDLSRLTLFWGRPPTDVHGGGVRVQSGGQLVS